ncbi:hypothetical protein L1987_80988 [Smallanthus sonchifolius]|uniref:Uncharacterized protein n=1 Tax=Smallanthus sonchifolius TaxID=185202 RepID=A0ACB8YQT0_9ASTR|nr:hypothetical protein L1987_80988 [Smallanthus sonchifolius]
MCSFLPHTIDRNPNEKLASQISQTPEEQMQVVQRFSFKVVEKNPLRKSMGGMHIKVTSQRDPASIPRLTFLRVSCRLVPKRLSQLMLLCLL